MLAPNRPIDRLTAEWMAIRRGPESQKALQLLAEAEALVAALGGTDLGDVVTAIGGAEGSEARDHAAAVLRAMVRSQSVHPLVGRAILQAMLPGLINVARRLGWGSGGEWEGGAAFFGDVLTTAWEVIADWAGQDRPYAAGDLLSAVRCRLRRQLLGQRDRQRRVVGGLDPDAPALRSAVATDGGLEDDQFARSIVELSDPAVEPLDTAVLYGTCVLGLNVAELARLAGITRRQVGKRRERAARALFA
jgi:hypothetical protein